MKLYGYWRSSASYRVRIALALKGLQVEHIPVNLKDAEQRSDDYVRVNPERLVPTLELEDGERVTQTLAIIEYLDEAFPASPLLPHTPLARARVKAAAQLIACDTSPIQNLRVLKYLRSPLGHGDEDVSTWAAHWIATGLEAAEVRAEEAGTDFWVTDAPGFAECFLIPQIYNARRFGVDMDRFPRLSAVEARCLSRPDFDRARPENQPDAAA